MGLGSVVHVVGARPNFVKMAPVIAALEERGDIAQRIVHTGQHVARIEGGTGTPGSGRLTWSP
jgi:UDP-N-acetylglucosamine 2-epimerase